MLRWRIGAPCGLRWGLLSLATAITLVTVLSDPADARSRRKRTHTPAYSPGYAAIVVDANSGAVLHASNPDATRHPASLTKIMTLFMLFERLESGRLSLDSPLQVSEHAADQSPTKLGLREGSTISVEDAIKGMVTRSANDAAAVVAENLAGSEAEFGRQMTRKARALGMSNTVYRNASGLPDSAQVTTARDQAILGRAIQERFPRYYRYFSTRSFTFRGQRIGNHNRLLGRVEGVDGIKTGYIRASGFNLVTSVKRDGRHVVAVVLGGASAGARDARMHQLLAQHVDKASTKRTAPMIAEARDTPAPRAAQARAEVKTTDRFEMASAVSTPVRTAAKAAPAPQPTPSAGSSDPIRPVAVRTVSVRPGSATRTASVVPIPVPPQPIIEPPATVRAEPPARAGILGYLPTRAATATASVPDPISMPASAPPARESEPAAATPSRPPSRTGWVIQVGALPTESEAQQRLASVRSKASRLLSSANAFTEPVQRGETTLYRARFAVLDREQAEAACKYLKRNDVDCLAMRN